MSQAGFDVEVIERRGWWRSASFHSYLWGGQSVLATIGRGTMQPSGNISQYVLHIRDGGPVGVRFREEQSTEESTDMSLGGSTDTSPTTISNGRAGRYHQRDGMVAHDSIVKGNRTAEIDSPFPERCLRSSDIMEVQIFNVVDLCRYRKYFRPKNYEIWMILQTTHMQLWLAAVATTNAVSILGERAKPEKKLLERRMAIL